MRNHLLFSTDSPHPRVKSPFSTSNIFPKYKTEYIKNIVVGESFVSITCNAFNKIVPWKAMIREMVFQAHGNQVYLCLFSAYDWPLWKPLMRLSGVSAPHLFTLHCNVPILTCLTGSRLKLGPTEEACAAAECTHGVLGNSAAYDAGCRVSLATVRSWLKHQLPGSFWANLSGLFFSFF